MKKLFKIFLAVIVLAVLAAAALYAWRAWAAKPEKINYRTASVTRGDLVSSISSTGTVEPEELVNVGAQVGGMITEFGRDAAGNPVDYCSPVRAGTVLARIDDALYKAELAQAEAQKLKALAAIASAEAAAIQAKAKLELATLNFDRAKRLHPTGALAKSDYDSAQNEFLSAKAAITVNSAAIEQAKAQYAEAVASLAYAKRNLGYCVIASPVDGVIIDRRVNIGQTVVSSMSAPSLFLIAKDLKKMQVWISVNEADIGRIKPGMKATFTVDAFPNETFVGHVQKIRLNATMSQNVVTYVVEVGTDNSSGRLLPYLTANVKFIVDSRRAVLSVPNAALRFSPETAQVPLRYRAFSLEEGERAVWVLRGGELTPVACRTGLNDGTRTEIVAGALTEKDLIVTSIDRAEAKNKNAAMSAGGSPFLPKMPRHPGMKSKK